MRDLHTVFPIKTITYPSITTHEINLSPFTYAKMLPFKLFKEEHFSVHNYKFAYFKRPSTSLISL